MPRISRRSSKASQNAGATGPGYDGMRELGGRIVEDPFDPANTIAVPANVRHDPLLRMYGRKEIDNAQMKAGQLLQESHEAVNSTGVRAVDSSRDVVDGGSAFTGLSDHTLRAARRLREAQALLGWQGYRLVVGIVCQGLNGSLIAQQSTSKVDREAIQFQVRHGLEQLAILWGLASNPNHVRKQASMVGMMREKADWGHAEPEINIRYSHAPGKD